MTAHEGLRADRVRVTGPAGRVVLDGLVTHAAPGRVLALTGPSGSGKTTLLRALLGCLPPGLQLTAGSVRWRGGPLPAGRAGRRWRLTQVGWLAQDPASTFDPWRPVLDQVTEALADRDPVRRAARAHAATLLERLGLDPDLHMRTPERLSGGQAQRAALARALAGDPPLLVLDEPTSGLDPDCARLAAEAVNTRRGDPSRVTVLVSHDRRMVADLADDVTEIGAVTPPRHPASVFRRADAPAVLTVRGLVLDHPAGGPPLLTADLTVHAGELVALLGPSGSGKSTLLRALAGLHAPAEGTVYLSAPDVSGPLAHLASRRSRAQLRRIQLVGQNPRDELNPAHRAVTAVARPLRTLAGLGRAPARAQALRLLADLDVDAEHAARRPGRLSGGQRQRVVVARAVAPDAAVLLADEITSALDAATATRLLDLLDRLRADGLAVLLATHDQDVAARADRVLHLSAGTLHEQDMSAHP
ncbi:ABC transporter ATP-binding protein [Nonomuraea insulae]|uniref:ABC transporter ATP-binding protein n=1 Tax=Nonomuraea insulae TaxID=1616787 RepID=A0ABW1D7C2_9ACTN